MRLAAKLMTVFISAILLVTGAYGYLAVQREEQIFAERANNEAERFAAAMEPAFRGVWQRYGAEQAVAMLPELPVQGYSVRVRWVWFDAPRNDPFCPSMPLNIRELSAITRVFSVPAPAWDELGSLYAYRPLDVDTGRQGGFEFAYPLAELRAAKRQAIVETLTLLGALVAVTGVAVVAAGVTMVGKPLKELTAKTQRIAQGELAGPLHLNTGDELSLLAHSLNDLCVQLTESQEQVRREAATRIAALEQLRHADRLRTVGRLASGIAHELGTPLNVISGHADLMMHHAADGKVVQSAAAIKREADRMTTIIRQLLDFARRGKGQRTHADLRQVTQQAASLLAPLAAKREIKIEPDLGTVPAIADVDVAQIQQVLTNVLMNAIQASPESGRIRVVIWVGDVPPSIADVGANRGITISIQDQGEGIPFDQQQQIFEPFFTTKDVGEGTGLGLSIAYRILEEHGGKIEVESERGQGACFTIHLPAV